LNTFYKNIKKGKLNCRVQARGRTLREVTYHKATRGAPLSSFFSTAFISVSLAGYRMMLHLPLPSPSLISSFCLLAAYMTLACSSQEHQRRPKLRNILVLEFIYGSLLSLSTPLFACSIS
jgi:hypothetical protein